VKRASRRRARLALRLLAAALLAVTLLAQQPPDRTHPPVPGPAPQLRLPAIQKRILSNGLAVWIVETHEVPLVQVSLLIKAGNSADPQGKFGLASLTAAMLDEGAGGRSALEIADSTDFLGASLTTGTSFDASSVRVKVPVAQLAEALPLLADVALRPTFPEEELRRLRDERLTALLQARDDPGTVANIVFWKAVFGPTHRYGTGSNGTEATLKSITTQDLRNFHTAIYRPDLATLIVVGDTAAESVMPLLEKQFGSWRSTTRTPPVSVPQPPPLQQSQITLIDFPGARQSDIRIGGVGAPRSDPDYFSLQVLNTVLGGSFTSRLNQNLREKNGYSYGVSSRFEMRRVSGFFITGGGVQTDKTAEGLKEFFNELNGIAMPVGLEELSKARNYIALGFPGDFETINDLCTHLEELATYDLPDSYFDRYIPNVQSVTADEVLRSAMKWIQPGKFAIVVAGDRKVIEEPVRALNLAPVRVLTIDEAFR